MRRRRTSCLLYRSSSGRRRSGPGFESSLAASSQSRRRKRKKRRKKKTPKASSSRGRARRRQRQRHVSDFPDDVLLRAVFPSVVDRLFLRRAEEEEKERRKRRTPRTSSRSSRGRARRRQRQWHPRFAGLPGDVLLRAVSPSVVVRPEMLDIMAVMNEKDSTTLVVNHGSGMCWFYWEGPLQWRLQGWYLW